MFNVNDMVIIKKGSNTLKVAPGTIGRVTNVKSIPGSRLLPGQDKAMYWIEFVSVDVDGQSLLFGPVDKPLQKVFQVCTVEERDAQRGKRLNAVRFGLRYRQLWKQAKRELVEQSSTMSQQANEINRLNAVIASKDIEISEMHDGQRLAMTVNTSTASAADVTEGMYTILEAKYKALEKELTAAKQTNESAIASAKRPQITAESLLNRMGYSGDLLDMINALVRDRDIAQRSFNGAVAADSEPGKIEIIKFPGVQPEATELPPTG